MNIDPVGTVRKLSDNAAVVDVKPVHANGLHGLAPGDHVDILYWMHELPEDARRVLRTHPRGDRSRPQRGVFALRSPMRPNPIGVTCVEIVDVGDHELQVRGLDAHDGSPVLDIKAARGRADESKRRNG